MAGFGYMASREIGKLDHGIKTGRKTVVRGVVTGKTIGGDETDLHYIQIDQVSVFVRRRIYHKYKIGDAVEFHIFKDWQNLLLHEEKLGEPIAGIKA